MLCEAPASDSWENGGAVLRSRWARPGGGPRPGAILGLGAALILEPGPSWGLGSGRNLSRGAAGAKHGGVVLDEELGEDVEGREGGQGHGALGWAGQVHPKHTRQVGGAPRVVDALLGHLPAQRGERYHHIRFQSQPQRHVRTLACSTTKHATASSWGRE